MTGIDWETVRYEAGNAGLIVLMTILAIGLIVDVWLIFGGGW